MPTLKLIPNGAKGQVGSRSCADSEGYMFGRDGDRALGVASVNCLVGQPGQFTEQVMATRTAWGKQHLKIEAYQWVLAFGADELDPNDPEAVSKALELASTLARTAWPTRQTLAVAQNDGEFGLAGDLMRGALASEPPTTWEDALDLLNRTPGLRKAQVKVTTSRGKVTGKRLVVTLDEPNARPFDAQRGGDDLAYDALTALWEQNEEDRYYAERKAERDAFMAYMFPDDEDKQEPAQPEHAHKETITEQTVPDVEDFDPVASIRAKRQERAEPSALDKALQRLAVEEAFAKLRDGEQEAEVG